MLTATLSKDRKKLHIEIDVNETPEPSKTGKTLVVASSHGNKETDLEIDGKKVIVGLNAYVYAR